MGWVLVKWDNWRLLLLF